MLLRLEGVHLDRHFRGRDDVGNEDELPAAQLRTVAEVQVLGQGVVLPTARIFDDPATPDAGGAVEVEEAAGAVAPAVLEHEVAVEQNRLDLREQRVILVDVSPARLHHADLRVGKIRHQPEDEVGVWLEVGVEDGNEFSPRHLEPCLERPGLVPRPIAPVVVLDVEALAGKPPDSRLSNSAGFIGRVVEHL